MFELLQRFSKLALVREAKKMDVFGLMKNGLFNELLVDIEKYNDNTSYLLRNGYSSN